MNATPVVYVVDDDPSVSKALARLFRAAGFRFAAFATAREFLNHQGLEDRSCLVLDVQLPDQSGLDMQRELNDRGLALSIVFITGHGDVPMAVEAMRAGAVHFLQKPFDNQELLAAVRRGIEFQCRACAQREESRQIEARLASLSPREREVFGLVAAGLANKNVAAQMGLCLQTVKLYRGNVMRKLGLKSVAELVRLAEKTELALPGF